jgi:hypothetical protein
MLGNGDRIAFFGASVTEQKNGYPSFFSILEKNCKVQIFGYGSMHISDAGVCYLPEVLKYKPSYCFLDWFSTGIIKEENLESIKNSIDYILHFLIKNKISPIWLIIPDLTLDKTKIYKTINEYLTSQNQSIIDISKENKDWSKYLRDGIHTQEKGAEFYGKIVHEQFQLIKTNPQKTHAANIINRIGNIKRISLKYREYYKEINLEGNGCVVGISQIVGPFTGMLIIDGKPFTNWDRWCHFERKTMKMAFSVNEKAVITVLNDDLDTSTCREKCNWIYPKKIIIKDIFYTGKIKITKSY